MFLHLFVKLSYSNPLSFGLQVPQGLDNGFSLGSLNFNNTTTSGLATGLQLIPSEIKPIPDFDTLLSDISSTLEASIYCDYGMGDSFRNMMDKPLMMCTPSDDVTFYEDVPMAPLKTEKVDLGYPTTQQDTELLHQQEQQQQFLASEEKTMTELVQVDPEADEVAQEMKWVCTQLGIPIGRHLYSSLLVVEFFS